MKDVEKINYTLYDISNAVNTTRNLKELYQSIYTSLNRLMPLPNFYIAIYDHKKKTIHFDYFIDEYDDDFPIIEPLEKPGCLTGEVILAGRPLFLKENMLMEWARKNRIVGTVPKIWLGVPLIIQGSVIGAICVQHYSDPGYFSHRQLEILVSVSDQIAVAIERRQILDALENSPGRKTDPAGTGNLLHDFNILLTGIMGSLDLLNLDQKTLSESQKAHITSALASTRNALSLLGQWRDLNSSEIPAPLKTAMPEQETRADDNEKAGGQGAKTVLVIEDEDMVRDMAVKALKAFGYHSLEACDGEEGLEVFKKNQASIDAVLLDIIMPKRSGAETFREMLRINPDVKVIVASGHVTNQDQQKIFAKAWACLEKPYQIMELKQTLESIFQKSA
nr:response regulator [Desulfobacula sp.]